MFAQIAGNSSLKKYFARVVQEKTWANSWLFAGREGIGKKLFAMEFARLLLSPSSVYNPDIPFPKHHPDLHIYHPDGKLGMHSIDTMRRFSEEVYLAPYQASWRVFILDAAERMLSYSANALLKTFEEPSPTSIIILISHAPDLLLPTIRSRCRTIPFHPLSLEEMIEVLQKKWGKSPSEAAHLARMSYGSPGKAVYQMEQGDHALRRQLLHFLSKGKTTSYREIRNAAQKIAVQSEALLKETRVTLTEELTKEYRETPSSIQQEAIEKEVEGALALQLIQYAHEIFEIILGWQRDMQLIAVNGNREYLYHPDAEEACFQALQRGEMMPLEGVQKALDQAHLALARSTPLSHVLENLLIQLEPFPS
jgi:DNA polymerase-3 subunit delta'